MTTPGRAWAMAVGLVAVVSLLAGAHVRETLAGRARLAAEAAALRTETAEARRVIDRWAGDRPAAADPEAGVGPAAWTVEAAAGAVVNAARAEGVEVESLRPSVAPDGRTRIAAVLRGRAPRLATLVGALEEAGGVVDGVRLRAHGGRVEASIDVAGPAPAVAMPPAAAPPAGDVEVATLAGRVAALASSTLAGEPAAASPYAPAHDGPAGVLADLRARLASVRDPFASTPAAALAAGPGSAIAVPPPLPLTYTGRMVSPRAVIGYFRTPDGRSVSIEVGQAVGEHRLVEAGTDEAVFEWADGRRTVRRGGLPAGGE